MLPGDRRGKYWLPVARIVTPAAMSRLTTREQIVGAATIIGVQQALLLRAGGQLPPRSTNTSTGYLIS